MGASAGSESPFEASSMLFRTSRLSETSLRSPSELSSRILWVCFFSTPWISAKRLPQSVSLPRVKLKVAVSPFTDTANETFETNKRSEITNQELQKQT